MPVKKDPALENAKNISAMFKEVLGTVDVSDIAIIDRLEGEQRRDFCKWCYMVYHSEHFDLLFRNFVYASLMLQAERKNDGTNHDYYAYTNGQMAVNGIQAFKDLISHNARIFETEFLKEDESFDKHSVFPKPTI